MHLLPTIAATLLLITAPATSAQVFFSEDFESLTSLTSTEWTIDASGATASLDTTNPKNGKQAMRLDVVQNGRAFLVPNSFAPPGNSFFGRLNLFVQDFPLSPDFAHWINVEAKGSDDPTLLRPIGGQWIPPEPQSRWGVGADLGPTGDFTDHQPTTLTVDRTYICMEFHVNSVGNSVEVSIDGVPKPELTINQTHHGGNQVDLIFPTFNSIKFGWQLFQQTTDDFTVFIDDIALSTEAIGCDPVGGEAAPETTTEATAEDPATTEAAAEETTTTDAATEETTTDAAAEETTTTDAADEEAPTDGAEESATQDPDEAAPTGDAEETTNLDPDEEATSVVGDDDEATTDAPEEATTTAAAEETRTVSRKGSMTRRRKNRNHTRKHRQPRET